MKVYLGVRTMNGCEVYVCENHEKMMEHRPLKHLVVHSPDGYEWGYYGSGPADLSLSILADYFGEDPSHKELYQGHFDIPEEEFIKAMDNDKHAELMERYNLKCWKFHNDFKDGFVGRWDRAGWTISGEIITRWVEEKNRRESKHEKK